MSSRIFLCNAIFALVVSQCGSQHIPTVMLKQAAENLLESPFQHEAHQSRQRSGLALIDIPTAEDLLIRRLQGELSLRVQDNWLSINDPQRWIILQEKGAALQILKSFTLIKDNMIELEQQVNINEVEKILNNLSLDKEEMRSWLSLWGRLRREVGQIAQLYNYFKAYVDNPAKYVDRGDTLKDFSSSIVKSSVEDRSMQSMLNNFHDAVIPEDSQMKHLFPYLHSLLSKVVDFLKT